MGSQWECFRGLTLSYIHTVTGERGESYDEGLEDKEMAFGWAEEGKLYTGYGMEMGLKFQ